MRHDTSQNQIIKKHFLNAYSTNMKTQKNFNLFENTEKISINKYRI